MSDVGLETLTVPSHTARDEEPPEPPVQVPSMNTPEASVPMQSLEIRSVTVSVDVNIFVGTCNPAVPVTRNDEVDAR